MAETLRPYTFQGPMFGSMSCDHGFRRAEWNGDRVKGWTFYCGCGFCTIMRRSYEEGFDLLEQHWQRPLSHALDVYRGEMQTNG